MICLFKQPLCDADIAKSIPKRFVSGIWSYLSIKILHVVFPSTPNAIAHRLNRNKILLPKILEIYLSAVHPKYLHRFLVHYLSIEMDWHMTYKSEPLVSPSSSAVCFSSRCLEDAKS